VIRGYFIIAIAGVLLAGCQSTPNHDAEPFGAKVSAPTGHDGTTITNASRYWDESLRIQKMAETDPDIIIEAYVNNPMRRPTVVVQYHGKPPRGLLKDIDDIDSFRHYRKDGDVVIYDSDLAQMTLVMEHHKWDRVYDYREFTTVVPYALCLDFIEANMGRQRDNYILRKVTCDQDNLGHNY